MTRHRAFRVGLALAGVDVALLSAVVLLAGASAGELLLAAWAQAAIPVVTVPLLLLVAAHRAPDGPAVDAGDPAVFGQHSWRGSAAARANAVFFVGHFGLFALVLGVFAVQIAAPLTPRTISGVGLVAILARAALLQLPAVVRDARRLAADGYERLAERSNGLLGWPYLQVIPLHLGILGLAVLDDLRPGGVAAGHVVAVVAVLTVVGSVLSTPGTHGSGPPTMDGPEPQGSVRQSPRTKNRH